jgi:hypothetical protein
VWNGFAWDQLNVETNSSIIANVRSVSFETTGPGSTQPGTIAWNPVEDCLDVYQGDGTILQTGLENYIRVHNHTGSTLNDGTVVMFAGVEEPHNGSTDHLPSVVPFVAEGGQYPPLYLVGVLTQSVANGENGRATTLGKVRGLNTTGTPVGETWAIGDLLWAHPTTPGALTNVRPSAPDQAVSIAAVLHVGTTDGVILVRPTIFPQLHMGTFYSTVTQTAAQANTPYAVTFNSDGLKCVHINRANTSEIVCAEQGLYKFEFRLHLQAPKNQIGRVWVWARIDGVDIPDSATEMSMYGSGTIEATMYPSWSFQQSINAGGTFQLMWATDNTGIVIYQPTQTAFAPASRSAAMRVTQVNL